MKKYVFLLLLLHTSISFMYAQCPTDVANSPCCNAIVSTDPRNGGTINADKPSLTNKYNWMAEAQFCYYPPFFTNSGANFEYRNPFFICEDRYLSHINLHNYGCSLPQPIDKMDFHPEAGWELLHRQNGLDLDEMTRLPSSSTNRSFPYYILYNKYQATVRLIGASNRVGSDAQNIAVEMGFPKPTDQPLTNISALMTAAQNNAQTLDKPSQAYSSTMSTQYPTFGAPFVADFKVNYDPCACGRTPEDISFSFSSLTTANIVMSGRMIGTNVPLNGSGNSPLLNRQDFLMNVYQPTYTTVNGGATTYKNIGDLVTKFKTPERTQFEKLVIDGIKTGSKAGINFITGGIATELRDIYCKYAYFELRDVLKSIGLADDRGDPSGFLKDGKLAAGALASGADFVSGLFFDKPNAVPNISFIEAELALKGEMTTSSPFHSNTIRLAHPGTLSTRANLDWKNFPFYNEALGIVSFLKTPKAASFVDYTQSYAVNPNPSMEGHVSMLSTNYGIKLTENIEYYFNPTLNVDLDKTAVLAAFVVDVDKNLAVNRSEDGTPLAEPFAYFNKIGSFNRVIDANNSSKISYITNFFPLNCVQDMAGFMNFSNQGFNPGSGISNPRLRIWLNIVYKANQYGKVNKHDLIYTFPLSTTNHQYIQETGQCLNFNGFDCSNYEVIKRPTSDIQAILNTASMSQYPFIDIIKDKVFTENTEIRAWQIVYIAGNIQINPNVTVRIIAPEIEVAPGTTLPPNMELIAGSNPMNCTAKANPVSDQRIKQFCNSNEYKANIPKNFVPQRIETNVLLQNVSLQATPNPFSQQLNLKYELQQDDEVELMLYNMLGQVVKVIQSQTTVAKGTHELTVTTNDLQNGIYLLSLKTKNGIKTQKVLKTN